MGSTLILDIAQHVGVLRNDPGVLRYVPSMLRNVPSMLRNVLDVAQFPECVAKRPYM